MTREPDKLAGLKLLHAAATGKFGWKLHKQVPAKVVPTEAQHGISNVATFISMDLDRFHEKLVPTLRIKGNLSEVLTRNGLDVRLRQDVDS